MILKYYLTKFDVSFQDSSSCLGLRAGDNWVFSNIAVKNDTVDFNLSGEFFAKSEIKNLITILKNDYSSRKRVSFIKNYFVFYLAYSKKSGRKLSIKFIHINDKYNYTIILDEEEIIKFISVLEEFYCD